VNIRDSIYVVGLVLIIGAAALVWKMTASATDSPRYSEDHPRFRVDPSWPKPLPTTISSDGVAHRWVTGEIAGTCVDAQDNVVTFNRGWEVGVNGREHFRAAEIRNARGEVLATATGTFIEVDPARMWAKFLKESKGDAT